MYESKVGVRGYQQVIQQPLEVESRVKEPHDTVYFSSTSAQLCLRVLRDL